MDGSALTFSAWGEGQPPPDMQPTRSCVFTSFGVGDALAWDTESCYGRFNYVCKSSEWVRGVLLVKPRAQISCSFSKGWFEK